MKLLGHAASGAGARHVAPQEHAAGAGAATLTDGEARVLKSDLLGGKKEAEWEGFRGEWAEKTQ